MMRVDWWSWKCARCEFEAASQRTVNDQQQVAYVIVLSHIKSHEQPRDEDTMSKASAILRFKTAGYSVREDLAVDPGPSKCGSITDGVAFWHDAMGAWVLRYEDLMTIAAAATKAREQRGESATKAGAVARTARRVTGSDRA